MKEEIQEQHQKQKKKKILSRFTNVRKIFFPLLSIFFLLFSSYFVFYKPAVEQSIFLILSFVVLLSRWSVKIKEEKKKIGTQREGKSFIFWHVFLIHIILYFFSATTRYSVVVNWQYYVP